MITIKVKATGQVLVVTPNVAHDWIDSGKATLVTAEEHKQEQPSYGNRQMNSSKPSRAMKAK